MAFGGRDLDKRGEARMGLDGPKSLTLRDLASRVENQLSILIDRPKVEMYIRGALEERLVYQRTTFLKIVEVPRGKVGVSGWTEGLSSRLRVSR